MRKLMVPLFLSVVGLVTSCDDDGGEGSDVDAGPDCVNHPDDSRCGDTDAGASDSGSGADAGTPSDSGPSDTGPSDTGPSDTGPSDTGPSDTGPTDGGPLSNLCEQTFGLCTDTDLMIYPCSWLAPVTDCNDEAEGMYNCLAENSFGHDGGAACDLESLSACETPIVFFEACIVAQCAGNRDISPELCDALSGG